MQQRDDVWSREYSVCKLGSCSSYTSHWCYRQLQSTQEAEDSIREPHPSKQYRLQTTDYQHSLLPAQYLPWYMKQDLPSLPPLLHIRVYPPILLTQCGGSWCFNPPLVFTSFPSQSRLRSFTAWLLSVGSRPRWGLLDTRPETNERIKTQ